MKHSLNKSSMNVAVKASTFPRFYQQQSIAAKQVCTYQEFLECPFCGEGGGGAIGYRVVT